MKPILSALLLCGLAQAQTISIEEYEPKSTLVVPQHPKTRAKYPFIDVHNHQAGCETKQCVDKLVSDMDGLNLRVMVNLSGGYGDRFKRNLDALKGRYPNRFVVFANIDFTRLDDPDYPARAASQLEKDVVKAGAQGLKIFKNFGMDLKDGKGQRIHVGDELVDAFRFQASSLVIVHVDERILGTADRMLRDDQGRLRLVLLDRHGLRHRQAAR